MKTLEEVDRSRLTILQRSLLDMPAGKFEQLVASLLGSLLDIPVLVARAGFQFGGDAGTAGIQGRHLRLEGLFLVAPKQGQQTDPYWPLEHRPIKNLKPMVRQHC